ncbi:MAG: glycoside hydrolase family 43 protein [Bacteroidales bacterium]|nr:glycoside hydrolase family 43 protein [Bacteroidales bacterium]
MVEKVERLFIGAIATFFVLCTAVSCDKGDDGDPADNKPKVNYDTIYTYTNPVGDITNIGDPFIMLHKGFYYLYATSSGTGFKVWSSQNMADWTERGMALDRNTEGNNWGDGNFWAPEVKYINGRFYMTYSATTSKGMKIRIASSTNPLGPFINWSEPFLNTDNYSYIDGNLFVDNNTIYLYYVKDCSTNIINGKHVSQIFVVKLTDDLLAFDGKPALCTSPSQAWEDIYGEYQWNEGPFVLKHGDKYYLLYSSNYYADINYSVGYATASNPMGPWTKYTGNPVLRKNEALKVSGPGHCCVTSSPDSTELFMVYHTHTYFEVKGGNRNVCLDRISFDNGILKVHGPTRSPQDLPSGCKPRLIKK